MDGVDRDDGLKVTPRFMIVIQKIYQIGDNYEFHEAVVAGPSRVTLGGDCWQIGWATSFVSVPLIGTRTGQSCYAEA